MTLFGLDLAQDKQGKWKLFEIGGANSGMPGFKKIYGDHRIENQVYGMLRQRYGDIAINTEIISSQRFEEEHRIRATLQGVWRASYFGQVWEQHNFPYLKSEKAQTEWLEELKFAKNSTFKVPFPEYRGQRCTVLNWYNEPVKHPTVNPYVAQELTTNKLLQYILLSRTTVEQQLIPSALVGLGGTRGPELDSVLAQGDELFLFKPSCAMQSMGIKVLSREEAERFKDEEGTLWKMSIAEEYRHANKKALYLDQLVEKGDFRFEKAVGLVQPLVDTRKEINGEQFHTAIRAIVCNEQFVGAYIKYSDVPQGHYSNSKKVELFNEHGFPQLCERIVHTFLDESKRLDSETFRTELYNRFFRERGKITRTTIPIVGVLDTVKKIVRRI